MKDCRTCKYNHYVDSATLKDWVDCGHPITIAKTSRAELGDPFWVGMMTADMLTRTMQDNLHEDCPTWAQWVSP